MATKTIGQLTQATTINNGDELAIEQSGVTKRVAASVVRGDIVNANIKSDAAIAYSKLAALNSAQILVGNGSNVPTAVSVTGDVTISNAGVTAIAAGAVVTADVADAAITPVKLSQPYTLATAQASTSGSNVDFTGIPSWAKRVAVILNGVSTNGSGDVVIQLGASSAFQTTGYVSGAAFNAGSGGVSYSSSTSGFALRFGAAAVTASGIVWITNIASNTWIASGTYHDSSGSVYAAGGTVSLSGVLDSVRVNTANTFDAGSINIAYEG